MSRLDWPGLMRAGIRGLGLRPAEFWQLTPAELALMLGEAAASPPLTRARLQQLAAKWPDQAKGTDDGRTGRDGRAG
jgi:uncharacterized phage protein (TIGR02216 family)